ncbi:amidohydrolase family protein [Plantibacter sp. Mn2098]|uniref:amidohydrolase family protein n=1 Tax=Plantibacter sp. Mn2098 TaxID=3395266 RepID=UPI003BC8B150
MSFIVDAHLHVWDPEHLHYDWLRDVPPLNRRMVFEELAAARATERAGADAAAAPAPASAATPAPAVDGYVFVQAACRDDEAMAEVDWVTSLAADAPILGIVAHAQLEDGDGVASQLDALRERELVVGVRRLLQSEPVGFGASASFIVGARALADRGLSFDATVVPSQLADVVTLADAAPELRIVLDHLGKPVIHHGATGAADAALAAWRTQLTELAARPNTWCKLSGVPALWPDAGWTPADLTPWLDTALEVFGADRCLWGSDWPASSLQTGYDRWLAFIADWTATLSPTERDAILGGSAARVYRLSAAEPASAP